MRPASHIPLADRITLGRASKFTALDSSEETDNVTPSNQMGLMPCRMMARVSSSKFDSSHCRKMLVASTARGESTYTGK